MTVSIPHWAFPIIATVLLWAGVTLWPISSPRGDYNFGGAFEALMHLTAGVVGTLIIWLVYFAVMWGAA